MNKGNGDARLIIVCGLPGSGKTTLAKEIESELSAIRFCPDEWMETLSINLWDEKCREKIEYLQWDLAKKLMFQGLSVIIEWGTWGRTERDTLRSEARAIGASVELHYLNVAPDVLFQRIKQRNAETPPIRREMVDQWFESFQAPTIEEMKLFDAPIFIKN